MARSYELIQASSPPPCARLGLPCMGAGSNRPSAQPPEREARGARAPASPAGLSKCHILTGTERTPRTLTVWQTGSLCHLEGRPPRDREAKEVAKRGKITTWSNKSRFALKCALGKVPREALGASLFVTLTYPGEFPPPDDHGVYKDHLRRFLQEMSREWATAAGIWKLEFQERGAAHYHLLVTGLGAADLDYVRQWVGVTWYRIVGSGDEKHLRFTLHESTCQKAKSVAGAMSYLAKYVAKADQTLPGNFTGRYWGKFNRAALPESPKTSLILTGDQANRLNRIRRKVVEIHVNNSRRQSALRWNGLLMASFLDENGKPRPGAPWPDFQTPKRYVARDGNGGGRLIGDAATFLANVQTMLARGLLSPPLGTVYALPPVVDIPSTPAERRPWKWSAWEPDPFD